MFICWVGRYFGQSFDHSQVDHLFDCSKVGRSVVRLVSLSVGHLVLRSVVCLVGLSVILRSVVRYSVVRLEVSRSFSRSFV